MGWTSEELGVSFPSGTRDIHLSSPQHTARLWRRGTGEGALSPEVKWPGCGADHSLPPRAEGQILRHGLVLNEAQK
jgi:hypothetical protein